MFFWNRKICHLILRGTLWMAFRCEPIQQKGNVVTWLQHRRLFPTKNLGKNRQKLVVEGKKNIWKNMLVKLDLFPKVRGKNKQSLKPPARYLVYVNVTETPLSDKWFSPNMFCSIFFSSPPSHLRVNKASKVKMLGRVEWSTLNLSLVRLLVVGPENQGLYT